MTEKSFVWTGVATGDASLAPYNADEFNPFITAFAQPMNLQVSLSGGISAGNFCGGIVPQYLDELAVESAGLGRTVRVKAGAAVIRDRVYVSTDEQVLELGNNPVDPTTDVVWIIVLRMDKTTQEVSVEVINVYAGGYGLDQIDNITNNLPAIAWNGDTWDLPLATVFVSGSATSVNQYDIRDRRQFVDLTALRESSVNLLDNSEHIIWGNNTANSIPTGWFPASNNTGTITGLTTNLVSFRGNSINLNASPANYTGLFYNLSVPESDEEYIVTLVGKVKITTSVAASEVYVRLIAADTNDGDGIYDPLGIGSAVYPFNGINVEFASTAIRYKVDYDGDSFIDRYNPFILRLTVPPNTPNLVVFVSASYATAQIEELILVRGTTAPTMLTPQYDFLLADNQFIDAGWNGVAKATATYTVDLSATYTNYIRDASHAILLFSIRDTNSAAGTPYAEIVDVTKNAVVGRIDLGGIANNQTRDLQVLVPLQKAKMTTGAAGVLGWRVNVVASGVMTVFVNLIGLIT